MAARWRGLLDRARGRPGASKDPVAALRTALLCVLDHDLGGAEALLQDLARGSAQRNQPFVSAFFGSPYVPLTVPELPAMLLTYDLSDVAEESAVRAIVGEIPISGKLPIALPGMFPVGHGLTRSAAPSTP